MALDIRKEAEQFKSTERVKQNHNTPGGETPYYPLTFSNTEGFSSIMVAIPKF